MDRLHRQIGEAQRRHGEAVIEMRWTPGHEGIPENERADEEAKRAARGDSSPDDQLPETYKRTIPISRSAALQSHHKRVRSKVVESLTELAETGLLVSLIIPFCIQLNLNQRCCRSPKGQYGEVIQVYIPSRPTAST